MAKWFLEPGHTAAEFCVRHMMVTYVRGHFKNVRGTLQFDPKRPEASRVEASSTENGSSPGDPRRPLPWRPSTFWMWATSPPSPLVVGEAKLSDQPVLRSAA